MSNNNTDQTSLNASLLTKATRILAQADETGVVAIMASRNAMACQQNQLTLRLPFYAPTWQAALAQKTKVKLAMLGLSLQFSQQVAALKAKNTPAIKGVKNVIVVASGKGGVGKSTVAVNLALALAQNGAAVGMLDADIYGPSVPLMLGQQEARPQSDDGKTMLPIAAHGIVANSIGFLVAKDDATVWRGPMASKALAQIIRETQWGELDYLVVDMPPGTGDIQLTLSQQVPVTSAIVVTTPQNVALADASKGINMFRKVDVPVVGVVENMSIHVCSQCGHQEAIFSHGGGQHLAQQYEARLLAQLPLHRHFCQDTDAGTPTVVQRPDSPLTQAYQQLAETVAIKLYQEGELGEQQISVLAIE
ncbi:iron-sulfur cluster carrier protein ApbC [Motilimonas sp. KMU-193]|uniref:iron-sulfur cluster carrier protein ApbC n=1 Tax=Motilimonas sp. KMU-193 TaxID=3388668 RepID=UPI00396B24C3